MKDFQRMYKKLNVNPGETKTLVISRTEAANNRFTFVFSGVDHADVRVHAKILISVGAENEKINLLDESGGIRALNCGPYACIVIIDFPIVSDIEVILMGWTKINRIISLGIHAGND